jgi:hypothetical protein
MHVRYNYSRAVYRGLRARMSDCTKIRSAIMTDFTGVSSVPLMQMSRHSYPSVSSKSVSVNTHTHTHTHTHTLSLSHSHSHSLTHSRSPLSLSLSLSLLLLPLGEHRASVKRFVSLQFLNPKRIGRTSVSGDQPVTRPLPTKDNKNTEQPQSDIHNLSWIRTHDSSVRES